MAHYVTIINQMTNATDGDLWAVHGDNFVSEGVKDVTSHYEVTEAGTPDMSVDVSTGIAYVENDSWTEFSSDAIRFWRTVLDATANVNISSNASGSTRIDRICIKVDTAISPGNDGELAASVVAVEGTPGAGAPAVPNDHLLLAQVEVGDGATSITNSEITDERVQGVINKVPTTGWIDADETWTYSSWTSATRIAEITVPTDATLKYSNGMRVRFAQSTGGTKHGIIHKVEATKLTVFVEADKTLENETISNPHYSTQKVPFGFPLEASVWSLEDTQKFASDITTIGSYVSDLVDVTIGVGRWSIYYQTEPRARDTAESGPIIVRAGLNTTSDTSTPLYRYLAGHVGRATGGTSVENGVGGSITIIDEITVTSGTVTYYGTCKANGIANQLRRSPHGHTVLRFTSAFL